MKILTGFLSATDGTAKIGGFDEVLGGGGPLKSSQDYDLQYRAYVGGVTTTYRPEVQVDLRADNNRYRADLYYPAARLILEYDGDNHRDRLVEDNFRQNLLLNAGFRLLRFTAADVYGRPDVVEGMVRSALFRPV